MSVWSVAPAVRLRACAVLAMLSVLLAASSVQAQEVVEYYGTDHLGSVRVVFDATGAIVSRADYLPYGEELAAAGAMPAERFTGQARDAEAGMDYFHARMYQPRTGRFNAVDPVFNALFTPQKWNRYSYALSNPLSFLDGTGEDCRTVRPPPTPAGNPGPTFRLGVECTPVAPSSLAEIIGMALATIATSSGPTDYRGPDWNSALSYTAPGAVAADVSALLSNDSTKSKRLLAIASLLTLVAPAGRVVGLTGKAGERALARLGGEANVYFPTSTGARFVDRLIGDIAIESKVGYTSLTGDVARQIAKDAELMANGTFWGRSLALFPESRHRAGWSLRSVGASPHRRRHQYRCSRKMTYSVIQPPFALEFHEMSREKLKEYFTWFMTVLPARRSALEAAVRQTPSFHEWQADLSPASLGPLGAWFTGQVESRPRTDEETLEIVAGLPFPMEVPPTTLTNRTLSLAMDIGMYLGETVRANVHGTKWSQELKNPRYAHHGQPVIVGQGRVPLNPVHITVMLAFGIASRKFGEGRLRELFDIWAQTLNS